MVRLQRVIAAVRQSCRCSDYLMSNWMRRRPSNIAGRRPPGTRVGARRTATNNLTVGDRIADRVAATMGSWKFIIVQTTILFAWIVANLVAFQLRWDPYPFILLNLALSFQAAYAAPFIMMSQNRQQKLDRQGVENDYRVNVKAELEIELLHRKIDELRQKEILLLTQTVDDLVRLISQRANEGRVSGPT